MGGEDFFDVSVCKMETTFLVLPLSHWESHASWNHAFSSVLNHAVNLHKQDLSLRRKAWILVHEA